MSERRSTTNVDLPTVAVVGGGFAGLVAAREVARRSSARVVVYEESGRAGGKVMTTGVDGIRVEAGPDSFLDRDGTMSELCRALGLGDQLVAPAVFGGRVLIGDRLARLPSPSLYGMPVTRAAALSCKALSPPARLRAAAEPAIPGRRLQDDIAVGEFVRHRFGREVLERLVDPLLAGTRAGDVDNMSLKAALPQVYEVVERHGSLMRGMAGTSDAAPGMPPFLALRSGMKGLIDALYADVKGSVELRFGERIDAISDKGGYYDLVSTSGKMATADALVIAVPSYVAARLIAPVDPEVAHAIAETHYASSASIALAYPPGSVPVPEDASGILVPSTAGRTISGLTYLTAKWPHLAPPDGRQVVRCFVGRADRHRALDLDNEALVAEVRAEVREVTGVAHEPRAHTITRWERGLPQYRVGHTLRIDTAFVRLNRHPRLALAGAGYRGSGLPDVAKGAMRAGRKVTAALAERAH